MGKTWLQGVVRNGRVELDTPLDLPDGATVIVTDCLEMDDDPRPPEPRLKLTVEELDELTLFITRKKDGAHWPAFEARLKEKYGPWLPHHFSPRAA